MINSERAQLDMRISALEQDVHDLKRELLALRVTVHYGDDTLLPICEYDETQNVRVSFSIESVTCVHCVVMHTLDVRADVANVRFFPFDTNPDDPRPSKTFARPVPDESPRCPRPAAHMPSERDGTWPPNVSRETSAPACTCTIDTAREVVLDAERGCPRGHRPGDPVPADVERVVHPFRGHEGAPCLVVFGDRHCDRPENDEVHRYPPAPDRRYVPVHAGPCWSDCSRPEHDVSRETPALAPEIDARRVAHVRFDPAETVVISAPPADPSRCPGCSSAHSPSRTALWCGNAWHGGVTYSATGEVAPDEREIAARLRKLGDMYAARVAAVEPIVRGDRVTFDEPTRSLPTSREAVPHWHDLIGEPRVDETLRIPVALLSVPVPTPRPVDDLCRCPRATDPHARSWCGTPDLWAASRP